MLHLAALKYQHYGNKKPRLVCQAGVCISIDKT